MITSDFNGDGYPDILVGSVTDQLIEWYPNNADGGLESATSIISGIRPAGLAAFDIDNDGDQDFIFGYTAIGSTTVNIAVDVNNGDGTTQGISTIFSISTATGEADLSQLMLITMAI